MTKPTTTHVDAPAGSRHGSAVVTLPSATEISITRVFDASASAVFRAWTTPELVKQWWGYADSEWRVCDVDLRVGGTWRWVVNVHDMEVGFHGEYREIVPGERLVTTEVFEGFPGGDEAGAVNTMTLVEVDGVTTMTILVQHAKAEHRDAHIQSGMEAGLQVSLDRMNDLVLDLDRP
jgi:uncharacterized protein YndB with AHSA1/START domain